MVTTLTDNVFAPAGSVIVFGSPLYQVSVGTGTIDIEAGSHGLLLKPVYRNAPPNTMVEFLTNEKACKLPLFDLKHYKIMCMNMCDALKGQSFCFSGDAEEITRAAFIKIIDLQGGFYRSSITKDCNFLVANDAFNGSKPTTKIAAAKARGTSIITTGAFLAMAKTQKFR